MLRVLPCPSVRDVDLVQDLYIKELKAYKAPEAVRSLLLIQSSLLVSGA